MTTGAATHVQAALCISPGDRASVAPSCTKRMRVHASPVSKVTSSPNTVNTSDFRHLDHAERSAMRMKLLFCPEARLSCCGLETPVWATTPLENWRALQRLENTQLRDPVRRWVASNRDFHK